MWILIWKLDFHSAPDILNVIQWSLQITNYETNAGNLIKTFSVWQKVFTIMGLQGRQKYIAFLDCMPKVWRCLAGTLWITCTRPILNFDWVVFLDDLTAEPLIRVLVDWIGSLTENHVLNPECSSIFSSTDLYSSLV